MARKLITLALSLVLVLSLIPAHADAVDPSTLEFMTFDWYFGQTEMPDTAIVNDAVNAYLLEKINANVNLHYWTAADFETRMTAMISSGEDVGIIGFGSQTKLDYMIQSQRGAYYPLDDLLAEYGQGTLALFDQAIWDGMRINGTIYGIPSLKDNGYYISLLYNAEMAEELGIDIADYPHANFRELEELFYIVKEGRDALHPEWAERPVTWDNSLIFPYNFALETFLNDNYIAVCNIPGIDDIAGKGVDEVFNLYETPEFLEFCLQKQRMVADGIYAYDYTDRQEWQRDGSVFGAVGWGYTYVPADLLSSAYTTKMDMSTSIWTDTNNFSSAGTAISSNSPEDKAIRQMMMLNLVNTDSDFATMMRFGVEGDHYTYDADGKMTFVGTKNEKPEERAYFHWYMAPIGNLTIVRAPENMTGPDNIMLTEMARLNSECLKAAHMGFSFFTENVANEIAACTNVVKEYQESLCKGQAGSQDEVTELVQEFNDKLAANGIDKVIEEVQKQIDAWKAA